MICNSMKELCFHHQPAIRGLYSSDAILSPFHKVGLSSLLQGLFGMIISPQGVRSDTYSLSDPLIFLIFLLENFPHDVSSLQHMA